MSPTGKEKKCVACPSQSTNPSNLSLSSLLVSTPSPIQVDPSPWRTESHRQTNTCDIQPSLSLVDHEVEFCVPTNQSFSTCCWGCFFFVFVFLGGNIIPVRLTAPKFELTSQRQKVSRLPTEPPGRPALRATILVRTHS